MKKFLIWALVLGALGALVADLRIFVNYYFFGDSSDINTGLILDNIFNSLFAACILATRGIVAKSLVFVAKGVLAGAVLGVITFLIWVGLNPPWPVYPLIRATLLGLSAGLIWGIGVPSVKQRLHACVGGIIGGVIGILIFYFVVSLTVLPLTLLRFFDINIDTHLYLDVSHFVGLVLTGAAQSVTIWYLIMRFDKHAISFDSAQDRFAL